MELSCKICRRSRDMWITRLRLGGRGRDIDHTKMCFLYDLLYYGFTTWEGYRFGLVGACGKLIPGVFRVIVVNLRIRRKPSSHFKVRPCDEWLCCSSCHVISFFITQWRCLVGMSVMIFRCCDRGSCSSESVRIHTHATICMPGSYSVPRYDSLLLLHSII
jgi:hypothetical protein